MICEKCGVEMELSESIDLNFTSRRFAEKGFFNVPVIEKKAEKYTCPECGETVFAPEKENDTEEQS